MDAENTTPEQENPQVSEERLVRERYEKAGKLAEAGTELFVNRFVPTHTAAQVREAQEELIASSEPVTLMGRVMTVRSFGKAGFLKVRDHSGDIQVYVKKDVTDEAGYEYFKKGVDGGDFIGATGRAFLSKTGELTIEGKELKLLTKSMRPLPEKWHGLKDVEMRYRQRYVDLLDNLDVQERFRTRSRIISFIRRFLDERGYMEVETPMMQAVYGGAAARPFITKHNALDMNLFLRIAPELFLKRLIVGGLNRVYEINRNFRNEGLSTRHNPEFTMMELYTAGWDYNDTMNLTEEMVRAVAMEVLGTGRTPYLENELDFESPFRRVRIVDVVAGALGMGEQHGLHWGMRSLAELRDMIPQAAQSNVHVMTALKDCKTADAAIVQMFEEMVEETLIQPTFVIDYPKSLCPLTKSAAGDPATAERFEFFVAGMELANAYSELNDPAEQRARFEDQVAQRADGDLEAMSDIDHDYVRALEYGMPPCSGLGIGIDRLVMLMTNSASIRDVILFPLMRPEVK